MICKQCGCGNAKMQIDPFEAEMNGDYELYPLCDDCCAELAADV